MYNTALIKAAYSIGQTLTIGGKQIEIAKVRLVWRVNMRPDGRFFRESIQPEVIYVLASQERIQETELLTAEGRSSIRYEWFYPYFLEDGPTITVENPPQFKKDDPVKVLHRYFPGAKAEIQQVRLTVTITTDIAGNLVESSNAYNCEYDTRIWDPPNTVWLSADEVAEWTEDDEKAWCEKLGRTYHPPRESRPTFLYRPSDIPNNGEE